MENSKTNGFKLTEFVDTELLGKIYPNNNIWVYDRIKYYDMLTNVDIDGKLMVNYKKKEYNKNYYGRYFINGLKMNGTTMSRRARSTLYSGLEYDIDLVSAHQSILKYLIVKEYGIEHFKINYPLLEKYIQDRDSVIETFNIKQEIIDTYNKENIKDITKKDMVKELHTIILYGGTYQEWLRSYDLFERDLEEDDKMNFKKTYIQKFVDEVFSVCSKLINMEKYKKLIEDVEIQAKKDKKDLKCNRLGKLTSLILQEEESNIISFLISQIKRYNKEWLITIYSYDGFQVRFRRQYKNEETDVRMEQLITNLNKDLKKEYSSILRVINKPFSKPFSKEELNDIDENAKYMLPYFNLINADELGYYIKHILKGKVVSNNGNYYSYNGKYWIEEDSQENIMGKYRDIVYSNIKKGVNTFFKSDNKKEEAEKIKIINTTSNSMITASFKIAFNSNVYNGLFDKKNELLNCRNGTLNLDTMELQPHNPNDFCQNITNVDVCFKEVEYVDGVDKDGKKIIKTKKIFDEEGVSEDRIKKVVDTFFTWFDNGYLTKEEYQSYTEYFLYYLGRSLHGNNWVEKAMVWNGKLSRNGKGTIMELLKRTLGSYVGLLGLKYFTTYDKSSNTPHPELLAIQGKRILDIPEVGGEELKIIPNKFKVLVGLDEISERTLYSNKMITFTNTAIPIFSSNHTIQFTTQGNDTTGKLDYFNFENYFGDETAVGWDNVKYKNHKEMDKNFKHNLNKNKTFHHDLLHILLCFSTKEINPPKIFVDRNNFNRKEVNSVDAWCDDCLTHNKDDIYFTKDDYIIKYNIFQKLTNIFSKKEENNKKLIRMLTMDFLYKKYKKDTGTDAVSEKNFKSVLSVKYKEFIPDKTTAYFGGRKKYITELKYNEIMEDDVENKEDTNKIID